MENWNENFSDFNDWALMNGWLKWRTEDPATGYVYQNWVTPEGNTVRITVNKDSKVTAISK